MTSLFVIDEAVFLYSQSLKLKGPHRKLVRDLWDWMRTPRHGCVVLIGDDSEIWSNPDMKDLLAMETTASADPVTGWVTNHLTDVYHKVLGRRLHVSHEE